jgi:hypothetical protein
MTATVQTCQYIGPVGYRPTCTHAALPGRSYCNEHLFVVYQAGSNRARRKKDERVAASVWDLESEFNAAIEELIAEGHDPAEPRWQCAVEESA